MKTPTTPSLHDRIINLPCDPPFEARLGTPHKIAYQIGFKDALSAAAALASEADAQIRELVTALTLCEEALSHSDTLRHLSPEFPALDATRAALARATGTDTGKGA